MPPTRVGLVGAGAISQAYLQAIQQEKTEVELCGVADVREAVAQSAAERFGCPAYATFEGLATHGNCDAVILCTPPNTHEELACSFLQRSIPVLCEKPLTTSASSAMRMLATARQHKTLLGMATKFRYCDDVVRAKSLLDSGILGEVILFENAFTARVNMKERWNSDPQVSGGGVLIDNGTHSVDLIRYFLGPVEAVQAVEGRRVQALKVEDTVQIFLRSRAGVIATIDLSWSLNKEQDSFINLYGSQGVVKVGWKGSHYRQTTSSDWVTFGKGYDKIECFRGQVRNFARAVRGEETMRLGPAELLSSVQIIEAAYRSLSDNNWTAVEASAAA